MSDNLFDLTGKIALVTGGSRGLGLEMVRAFASAGADVVVASRKLDACEAAADEVRALGREALAVSAHAGRWDDLDRLIEAAYQRFGRIDILVNNAGMSPRAPSHEVTEALFDSVVNLNFKGPFRLASQVAKRMADGEGGVIINISSSGALVPLPGVVPYAGAKAVRWGLAGGGPRNRLERPRPARPTGGDRHRGAVSGQPRLLVHHRRDRARRRRHVLNPGATLRGRL